MTAAPPQRPDPRWAERTRGQTRRYWDAHPIAVDSVEHEPGTPESFEALYARLRAGMDEHSYAWLEHCRGRRVLEMGCGIGLHARFLAENGVDYLGVDASRRSLALAREHFGLHGLRPRVVRADGAALPFADASFDVVFSDGVVHHIPDVVRACRELARVAAPGGTVRVMVYNRESYHYTLVNLVICPVIWLLLRVPGLGALARFLPRKARDLFAIAERHGFDRERLLSASTDTSSAGEGNYNPHSYFMTERELRTIFADLEQPEFRRKELRGFPVPLRPLRRFVERRFGFFLTVVGRKPGALV